MAEMGVAAGTQYLDPFHEETRVGLDADVVLGDGLPKARPARARIEFGLRLKQIVATAGTLVNAFFLRFVILPRKSLFGSFLTGYVKLLWCEEVLPLRLGFDDFVRHDESFLLAGIDLDGAGVASGVLVFLLC